MQHLTESLERVMAHNTIRYNGCLIYFTKGEYVWNRKGYKTIEEAKGAIDQSLIAIKNSITTYEKI